MDGDQWDRIEDLFHQVVELEPDQRLIFLDSACAGDDQVRREVESLLAADAPEGEVLESVVSDAVDQLPPAGDKDSELMGTRMIGLLLGPYRVIERIGAGGMAKVYKARDTRLDRIVAIKISAARFSGRFQREAKAIASLNHPHICTLYDVGPNYLVMEYIDGKQLKGPLAIQEVLRLGFQIADAVSHAHRHRLLHRDLKPGNIMVTKAGAKVLDFGLAKQMRHAETHSSPHGPVNFAVTQEGVILGTPNYMAPEQLEGREADARTDIFAFGALLYELITGRPPFDGKTQASLIASILLCQPQSVSTLQPLTPAALNQLITTCLAKDPDDRRQSMHDIMLELRWLAGIGSQEVVARPYVEQSNERENDGWWRIASLLSSSAATPISGGDVASNMVGLRSFFPWALAAMLGGLAVWLWLHVPAALPRPVTRWSTTLPDTWTTMFTNTGPYPGVALSRDGMRLVYGAGISRGQPSLTLRMLDQIEGQIMPGTGGGSQPAFSPDGKWIVFGVPGQLKKIPVSGGSAITICKCSAYGASWGIDNTIVFGRGSSKGLMRVPADGGTPETLTTPIAAEGEMMHAWPQHLPDGKSIVFTIGTSDNYDKASIAVLDLRSGVRRVVIKGAASGRYVPSGHLVYARGGALFAVPFDAKRLAITGSETPVVEGLSSLPAVGFADYAFADSGLLVYVAGPQRPFADILEWSDRQGARQPFNAPAQNYAELRFSPDGERIAFVINSADLETSDIWIYEKARGTFARVTFEGSNSKPVWTPDGRRVAYRSTLAGKNGIYWVAANGSGKPELLLATESVANPNCWTPNGKALLYSQLDPKQKRMDIWILLAPEGSREATTREFLRTPYHEQNAEISPDGRWVAYQSDESGQPYVYVLPFPGPGGKVQVSTQPRSGMWRWSRNGRELFYREAGEQLWVVDVQAGKSFRAGQPQALFKHRGNFDITPDGKRFLLVKSQESPSGGARLEATTDWFEDLRRRAPPR